MFNVTGKASAQASTELRASDFETVSSTNSASSAAIETKSSRHAGGFLSHPDDTTPLEPVPLTRRPVMWFLSPSARHGDSKGSKDSKAAAMSAPAVVRRTFWEVITGVKPAPFTDLQGARLYLDQLAITSWKLITQNEVHPELRQLRAQYSQFQGWLTRLKVPQADWPRLDARAGPQEAAFLAALASHAAVCGFALHLPVTRSELMLYLYLTGQYGTQGGIGVAIRREHRVLQYLETGGIPALRGLEEFDPDYPVEKRDFDRMFKLISVLDPDSGLPRFPVYGPMTGIHSLGAFGDCPQLAFRGNTPDEDERYLRERQVLPPADEVTFDEIVGALRLEERQIREGKSNQADWFNNLDTRNRVFDNTRTLLGQIILQVPFRKIEAHLQHCERTSLAALRAKFGDFAAF